jgi:hypothetical protein
MLADAITAVKTALLGLEDTTDTAIFTAATEIFTGYPHPDLIKHDSPGANEPIVATYFYGRSLLGRGYEDLIRRRDVVVGVQDYRRDESSLADLEVNCEVHILAATTDELVGTAAWTGYVEQILLIVRTHPEIAGPRDTIIGWDLDTFDIPGEVTFAEDRRVSLAIVKTILTGRLVGEPVYAARIFDIVPHDDEFTPAGP